MTVSLVGVSVTWLVGVPSRFGLRPDGACGHPAGEEGEWHPLGGTEGPASGSQNRAWLST